MMSNGPCSSCGRSRAAARSIVGRVDLLGRLEDVARGGSPRARGRAATRRSCALLVADRRAGRSRGRARPRLRSWQTARAGRARSRPAGQWCSRASSTSGLRASGCTLVASTTVSCPRASRFAGDEVQHLERVVGRRLVVLVVGDQAAAEVRRERPRSAGSACARTSTCRSRRRRRARRARAPGSRAFDASLGLEHRHLRRRAELGVLGPDRQEADRVAEASPRRAPPRPRTRARVHSKRWSRWRNSPGRAGPRTARCTRAFGVVTTTVAGRASSNTTRSKLRAAAGRGARSTSTTAAASKPASRWSR